MALLRPSRAAVAYGVACCRAGPTGKETTHECVGSECACCIQRIGVDLFASVSDSVWRGAQPQLDSICFCAKYPPKR